MSGFFYLATPYTAFPGTIQEAHDATCAAAAHFVRAGVPVFVPICHTHNVAIIGEIDPADHTIWLPFDEPMMDAADGIIVVMLEGWHRSKGIAHEVERFHAAGKPVYYAKPGEIPPEVLPMSQRQVIGLVGPSGAGKSEAIKALVEQHGFIRLHVANAVKRAAQAWNLSDRQIDGDLRDVPADELGGVTPRAFLEAIGAVVTGTAPAACAIEFKRRVSRLPLDVTRVVADGIRRQAEADAVRELGGIVVRISGRVEPDPEKPMDLVQASIEADAVVMNAGTLDDLAAGISEILNTL